MQMKAVCSQKIATLIRNIDVSKVARKHFAENWQKWKKNSEFESHFLLTTRGHEPVIIAQHVAPKIYAPGKK